MQRVHAQQAWVRGCVGVGVVWVSCAQHACVCACVRVTVLDHVRLLCYLDRQQYDGALLITALHHGRLLHERCLSRALLCTPVLSTPVL